MAARQVVIQFSSPTFGSEANAFLKHVLEHAGSMPNSLAWTWVHKWCVRNETKPTMSSLWLFLAEYSYYEMFVEMVGIADIADGKCAELEAKYSSLEAKHAELKAKCTELEEQKAKCAELEAKHAKLEAEYDKLKIHAIAMFNEGERRQRLHAETVQALENAHKICKELRRRLGMET